MNTVERGGPGSGSGVYDFDFNSWQGERDLYHSRYTGKIWVVFFRYTEGNANRGIDTSTHQKAYRVDMDSKYLTGQIWQYQEMIARYDKIAIVDQSGATHRYKGDYIEDVNAISGSYPANGIADDGYWYVLKTS